MRLQVNGEYKPLTVATLVVLLYTINDKILKRVSTKELGTKACGSPKRNEPIGDVVVNLQTGSKKNCEPALSNKKHELQRSHLWDN